MNILMMSNTYFPIVGGLEKSIRTFAVALRKMGHKVLIVAPQFKGTPKKEEGVFRLPAISEVIGTDFSINLPVPGLVSELMDSFKPHVIHSHHPFLVGDLAFRLSRQYQIPLVYTYHTMFDQYPYDLPMGNDAAKRFLVELSISYSNLADHIVAPSESVRDILVERGVETPITVVPTGIDVKHFANGNGKLFRKKLRIPERTYVAGHLGRLAPEKNLDFLAHSVSIFLRQQKKAHFLIIGKGPLKEEISKLFKENDIEKRVHFVSLLRGKDLINAYHAMDVFVFASQSETQGIVLVEAMAAGIPVVAVDAPGVREVVNDYKNGRLLPSENPTKFSVALAWCYSQDRAAWQKIKKEAQETAELFSIKRCAGRALHVYESVKLRKRAPGKIEKNAWEMAARRLKAEGDLFANLVKATKAALTLT